MKDYRKEYSYLIIQKIDRMDYSKLTVIIPTLNESETIGKLLSTLIKEYNGVSVIVSDDGSRDGTESIVNRFDKSGKGHVVFLDRSRKTEHGLTASVMDAVKMTTTKYAIVMDGDMQHPPEMIERIFKELDKGSDVVVGVRTKVKNWDWYRRILSISIIGMARFMFTIRRKRKVSDMMFGFFGIRTSLFKSLVSKKERGFVRQGYKVLLDILRMTGNSVRITEVPYKTFQPRRAGASKLKVKHMILILKSLSIK